MDLIYERPGRPNDVLVEGDKIVASGEKFTTNQQRARDLLAQLYPDVRPADDKEHPGYEGLALSSLDDFTAPAEEPEAEAEQAKAEEPKAEKAEK